MQISNRFSVAAIALAAAATPRRGRWVWGVCVSVLGLAALLYTQLPVDAAVLLGTPWMDGENATNFRAAILVLAVVVTLRGRNLPWYHTVIALLITLGHGGQVLRAIFSPGTTSMPLTLVFLNTAIVTYLIVLGLRPSVYELLAEERLLRADLAEEADRLSDALSGARDECALWRSRYEQAAREHAS